MQNNNTRDNAFIEMSDDDLLPLPPLLAAKAAIVMDAI